MTYAFSPFQVENVAKNITKIKRAFKQVLPRVNDFLQFSLGAHRNSMKEKVPDHVTEGFRRHLKPLKEDHDMLGKALGELDDSKWQMNDIITGGMNGEMDSIGSFVMTSRAVSDDAGQMAIYIHTHAQYLFEKSSESGEEKVPEDKIPQQTAEDEDDVRERQARPLPTIPVTVTTDDAEDVSPNDEWLEDYDYVAMSNEGIEKDSPEDSIRGSKTSIHRESKLKELEAIVTSSEEKFDLSEESHVKIMKMEIDVTGLMTSLSASIRNVFELVDCGLAQKDVIGLVCFIRIFKFFLNVHRK